MKEILEYEESTMVPEDIARSWYRKSHNHYEPGEQITRDYKKFDKCIKFGKPTKGSESRIRRILTWINYEPVTLVNDLQADFLQRTRSFVGQVKAPETSRLYADIVHGKKTVKDELDKQVLFWECLQDLHNFRRKLKKRIQEVPFLAIEDEFFYLDKEYVGTLPEDKIFLIFEKYRIYPNKKFFVPLMDMLQLRIDGNINYREMLNLLNWKRSLPVLPIIKQAPVTSLDCTTYNDSIKNIQTTDSAKVRAAELPTERSDFLVTMLPRAGLHPDKNLGDQTSIHCLISPSIFTRYGLTHIDFFKMRDKKEIRSIFENIGFEFPEESFDTLWQKGMQKNCTDGMCVETFRELLAASGFVAKKITCD
ncbi:EF-hand domain-containing family member B [Trachymyrmex septentrionalis]|uniref:EF-hand domain-containing family member B n=1 Tax=Trachymyrmex septentrionalis TaxID=34720 RepID=A0A195F1I6_9HYME|nr:PREDICTED: EF-hand domain-containing family member B-like [Trachymyrmex septentrionalis]KYN33959.1 EF-hand domain-containing family member B [Trachymyrmex septentrionalis]